MKAGFARIRITPSLGTTMMGFTIRDREHGCTGVHDDLFVRALYLEHEGEEVLVMGFDLCFLGRKDANRYKGAIGRVLDLAPRCILLNTTHTHAGPSVGTWAYADYEEPDSIYLRRLERAAVDAAQQARDKAAKVTMWAGSTKSILPMNRRKKDEHGNILFAPNPDGVVCNHLPICLFKDAAGKPLSLLFSVSCHASIIRGHEISADYPGAAIRKLDEYLGCEGSLFLQGAGGDAKPVVIGRGEEDWRIGTWEDAEQAGAIVAKEVVKTIEAGLVEVEPDIRAHTIEMSWPLSSTRDRSGFEAVIEKPDEDELLRMWAKRQIERIDRGEHLPTSVPITCHGVRLGSGLRIIGLEGEPVAELGLLILEFYKECITFPLGYTNGAQLYLPTSEMLEEGGYEVESYYEYGHPAPLAGDIENILTKTLQQMHARGIRDGLDR